MLNRSSKTIAPLLFAALGFAQAPAPPSAVPEKPATVEGEVRNALTQEPIERAHIIFRRMGNGMTDRFGVLTTSDGKFSIGNLPPGDYSIGLQRTGFIDLKAGSNQVLLRAGDKKDSVKLKLTPTGAITGRVLDSEGAPAEAVSVRATGYGQELSAITDDRGMFRIGGLPPGKYRVRVQVNQAGFPPEIRTDGTAEIQHAPTYYPSALDAKSATRVEVRPGAEATGVEIRLLRIPIIRVSGRVSGVPPDADQAVMVSLVDGGGGARVRPDGAFELWRVTPGKHTFQARSFGNGAQLSSAPVEVEVGQNDLDNVSLTLVPPMDISGKVEFEDDDAERGPQPPPRPNGPQQQAQMTPRPPKRSVLFRESGDRMMSANAPVQEDGTFKLTKLMPGLYDVSLSAGAVYVRSMQLGETHVDGGQLDLRNGSSGTLTLHVASATGSLSGTVRDDKGPVAEAEIALIDMKQQRPTPYRARSKADGTYTLQGLPPAKYRVFAVDELDSRIIMGGSREDFEEWGEEIELRDRESLTKDLKLRSLGVH